MDNTLNNINELLVRRSQECMANTAFFNNTQSLSYEELNNSTLNIAHWIRENSQHSPMIILFMTRSMEFIQFMFGILRAGGICIPLDSAESSTRLLDILNQIISSKKEFIILSTDDQIAYLQGLGIKSVVSINTILKSKINKATLPSTIRGDQSAFIFFTSGTSNKPKGVVLSHQAIFDGQYWLKNTFNVNPDDCLLFRSPIHVTNVVRECIWPILASAKAYVLDLNEHRDPVAHIHAVKNNQISNIFVTPALLDRMMDYADFQQMKSLKYVFVTSDMVNPNLISRYRQSKLTANFYNIYGLTEAFYGTFFDLNSLPNDYNDKIPIGRSAQLEAIVLNKDFIPSKIGETGELYLSGSGLATGYYEEQNLTENKFVTLPHDNKLYFKTGDLAKINENNDVILCGRKDFQIKIHGHRVETEEIEGVALGMPDVEYAGLTVVELNGFIKLILFYQAKKNIDKAAYRQFLESKLPLYFVPNILIQLEKMPLTSSGKIDRQKLKTFNIEELNINERAIPIESATTDAEKILLDNWKKYLKMDSIGIDNDFFSLGGDSIIAMLITAKCQEAGLSFNIADFFSERTIRNLAKKSKTHTTLPSSQKKIETPISLQSIQPFLSKRYPLAEIEKVFPVSSTQAGMLFHSLLEPTSGVYYEQLTHKIMGKLDINAFSRAWEKSINACQILRSAFLWENVEVPQHVVFQHVDMKWEFIDISQLSPAEQDVKIEETLNKYRTAGFDFSEASLLKLLLFKVSNHSFLFTINYHHILLDAWSFYLILKNALLNYQNLLSEIDVQSQSSELNDAFHQYVEIVRAYDYSTARGFWKQYLSNYDDPYFIAKWFPQHWGHFDLKMVISSALAAALRKKAAELGITVNAIFLAGWFTLLHAYSKRHDLVTGMIITHRPPIVDSIEKLIGVCVNTIPVRAVIEPNESKNNLLMRIFNEQKELRVNEYMPISEIQKTASIKSGYPLFDTLLIFENFQPDTQISIKTDSISFECIRYDGWTNYPLSLTINNVNNMSGLIDDNILSDFVKDDSIIIRFKADARFFEKQDILSIQDDFQKILNYFSIKEEGNLQELLKTFIRSDHLLNTEVNTDKYLYKKRDKKFEIEKTPHSAYKEKLEKIFFEVLGTTIKEDDNFFDHGGDSFKAMHLVGKVNIAFNIEYPLEQFFYHPSINEMFYFLNSLEIA